MRLRSLSRYEYKLKNRGNYYNVPESFADFISIPQKKFLGIKSIGLAPCIGICIRIQTSKGTILGIKHWEGARVTLEEILNIENSNNKDYSDSEKIYDFSCIYYDIANRSRNALLTFWENITEYAFQKHSINIDNKGIRIEISIIGGEVRTENTRGTKMEFDLLLEYARQLKVQHNNIEIQHYFPTTKDDSQDVSIYMDRNGCYYHLSQAKLHNGYKQKGSYTPSSPHRHRLFQDEELTNQKKRPRPSLTFEDYVEKHRFAPPKKRIKIWNCLKI